MRQTALVLILLLVAGCGPQELRVTMNADNNSGQSGFAVLVDRGARGVTVTVETSAPDYAEAKQKAHVHEGNCGEVGVPRGFLNELGEVPGKPGRFGSVTELGGLTFDLLETGDWIINVHDARDEGVYVSCGEIPRP